MCSYNKVNNTPACRVLESLVDVASIQLSNIGPIGISISEIEETIMKCIYILYLYTLVFMTYITIESHLGLPWMVLPRNL